MGSEVQPADIWIIQNWVTAFVAGLVFLLAVALRALSNGRIEIKLNDALVALAAAFLVLFLAGRIDKFAVTQQGITIETAKQAILTASAAPIRNQVAALPLAPIEEAMKGGADIIPSLVARQIGSLDFQLGAGAYVPEVIEQYLRALTSQSFFRFVTLLGPDRRPFGFIDGRLLLPTLASNAKGFSFRQFADAVNHGTDADRTRLSQLPGFLPASAAVAPDSDKRDVLSKMESLKVDWLPVVDKDGHVVGVVDQARLTASLILDVSNLLRQAQQPVK